MITNKKLILRFEGDIGDFLARLSDDLWKLGIDVWFEPTPEMHAALRAASATDVGPLPPGHVGPVNF